MMYFQPTKNNLNYSPPPPSLLIYCKTFSSPPIQTWKSFLAGTLKTRRRWTRSSSMLVNYRISTTTGTTIRSQGCISALQNCENDGDLEEHVEPEEAIRYTKWMLKTMEDGRISISAYDTAWVALIPNNKNKPQFPSSLEWIVKNQLCDGSWGDARFFSVYDRLLSTLACVIALVTWNIHPTNTTQRGIKFIEENMWKLGSADVENMTCGFELVFPALLEKSRHLGIYLHYDSPILQEIYARRDLKLKRIPIAVMHTVPTTLLYSLEGMNKDDLDWKKLLKLQTPSGSFLTSPASTALAVMETKDENCLRYLKQIVDKNNGGVPTTFPVDLFARAFAVDRLQRLGISRFFESEIKECLNYVHRRWTKNGIFSGEESNICDIDCTAMGFRLLRQHGYNVTPDVFRNFELLDADGRHTFSCFQGQINESPTPIFNLYRASQVLFPGEKILEDANNFSYNFLKQRLNSNRLQDKWVIAKDFAGEVRYGLEVPWYANLPRVETRFYMEQYGGADDVWIAKTLYRMPEINNNVYLELAKSDFNKCQAQHQEEWNNIAKWYEDYNIEGFGISRNKIVLLAYFLATANIFEPEKITERFGWAKTVVICKAIKSSLSTEQRITFVKEFNSLNHQPDTNTRKNNIELSLLSILVDFLNQLSQDSFKRLGRDIRHQLNHVWQMWLNNNGVGEASDDYQLEDAELIVRTLNLCAGSVDSLDIFSHIEYKRLSNLTNKICHKLEVRYQNKKAIDDDQYNDVVNQGGYKDMEIESEFQELVQLVYQSSTAGDGIIAQEMKQTFLEVAKTFYYKAYISEETIGIHISKLLFEPVL